MSKILETPDDCNKRIDELGVGKYYEGPLNGGQYLGASNLERTGWVLRGIKNPETIAQHQISACLMVVRQFRKEFEKVGLDISRMQDTLLIHNIAKPDRRVGDISPDSNNSSNQKGESEENVIREMFGDNPYLLNIWLDYKYGRTEEGKTSMEISKIQAIERASYYEELCKLPGLVEEFFAYAVVKKRQIQTDFLLRYAIGLYEDKAR